MPDYAWGTFAALMVIVATCLYWLGYRWYDHGPNGIGALFIVLFMGALLANLKMGSRK